MCVRAEEGARYSTTWKMAGGSSVGALCSFLIGRVEDQDDISAGAESYSLTRINSKFYIILLYEPSHMCVLRE